jgi:hypothetical protein
VTAELEKDLAVAVEVEPPKEILDYRKRWSAALAACLPFDYAPALAELAKPAEGAAKEEAAADLQGVQLAAEAAKEGLALVLKWAKGTPVKLERIDGGVRTPIEGRIWRVDPHEIELAVPGGLESIPLAFLSPATLGEVFASRAGKKPDDPLAAALLCALEGDLDGAARFGVALPERFKAAAAWVAADRASGPEGEAYRLFAEAEADFRVPASRLGSSSRYAGLLQTHAGTRLVRRLKPLLEERLEHSRETLLAADAFVPGGSFRWLEATKDRPESAMSAAEFPPDKASANFVEVEAVIPSDASFRAWVYVGACCLETAAFRLQAPELQGGTAKEPQPAEPGSPHSAPVRITLSLRAKHASHGGPKEPSRWGWVALPLPKYATTELRRIRLVTEQQGFAAAYVFLSAGRGSPPPAAELRELDKLRPGPSTTAATGQLLREYWKGIGGKEVQALTSHPSFPDRPSGSDFVPLFEGPTDFANDYGSRLRGYLHPPVNGDYVFFVVSDDHSELYLSSDENPARKTLLVRVTDDAKPRQWDHANARKSAPVPLRAGRRYYVEVLHKDANQGDNIAVGWQLPDGALERPIPGTRLSPWGAPGRPRARSATAGTLVRAVSAGLPAAATIDGVAFEGRDVAHVDWGLGQRMENQSVPLRPPAEGDKARMIRSSWWRREGLGVSVGNLPAGDYAVYLWFWEDTESQTFDVFLNDHKVRDRYASGPAGTWERLGPFPASPGADGRIWIRTSAGADANLSAVEIWKGIR